MAVPRAGYNWCMSISTAFIGTGIMGLPMATHLLNAGLPLTIHTRTKVRAQSLLDRGAHWAETPAEAARRAEVIFLNLPDTPDVEKVVLGLAESLRPGQIIVDHSTISPSATRALAEKVARRGAQFLDAPVSGGDIGARNATLSIMVGGDAAAFEKVKPLLHHLGKTIIHTGASGTGQLTKLVNQILVSGTLLAVCEALTFALKNGLDAQRTLAAVGAGAASSWQLQNLGPRIVEGDFAPGFMVSLMHKDLRLLIEAMHAAGMSLPLTSLAHHFFAEADSSGLSSQGTHAVFQVVQRLAKERK